MNAVDITGHRYGRLIAMMRIAGGRSEKAKWRCRCDCGKETNVVTADLRNGNTRSCGCLHTDIRREWGRKNTSGNPTHGLCYSGEYNVWRSMRNRCFNPKVPRYKDYGGRGISVCHDWMKFENFYRDMGPRPGGISSGGRAIYSLERLDNDGDYEPENCIWATSVQQMTNKRKRIGKST